MNESPRVLGNRYEVGGLLGRGGMAEVHLGRDTRLGRNVAIKLLRADLARDATFQARFRREAQSAAALNHPAIVAVYDTGEETVTEPGGGVIQLPYIVMEYVEGRTLREILGDGAPFPIDQALDVMVGVLNALEYSHRIGIVHRDIKPANVMLTPTGDVKVMDFGIARALADASSTMTQTQAVIGTAQYLSPEQARGEQVDTRSDLYSAGCLLYELLTSRPPFVADSPVAVAYQHVREQAVPPSQLRPDIPESVDRIVLHSLAKDREERYQTAAQFRADVEAARGGRQVNAPVPVVTGAEATTQYFGGPATGTTALPRTPAPTGSLLGDTGVRAPVYDDPYGEYRHRDPGRGSRRGLIVAVVLAVVVLAGVGFAVYKLVGGGGTGKVPDFVNLSLAKATQECTTQGLNCKTTTVTATADSQVGTVVSQDPTAGSALTSGQVITLSIGTAAQQVTVPDLSGKSKEEAQSTLKGDGLDVTLTEDPNESDTIDPGDVTRTDPTAGSTLAKGGAITVYYASDQRTVPSFVGQDRDVAYNALTKLGFTVKIKLQSSSTAAGIVLSQSPKDSKQTVGSTVTLVVSTSPTVTVTSPPPTTPTPTPTATPTATDSSPTPTGSPSL